MIINLLKYCGGTKMENLRIAIYGRKSVYSDKSDSIEAQFKLCTDYCTYHYSNYEITYYSDM